MKKIALNLKGEKSRRERGLLVGLGVMIVLIIFLGGISLGLYLQSTAIKITKDELYLPNNVTLRVSVDSTTISSGSKIKLRYKTKPIGRWAETPAKLAIFDGNDINQTFDLTNLKKAAIYEYQTQIINNKGVAQDWSSKGYFATARQDGQTKGSGAVALVESDNLSSPGDISFDGKMENADYYTWDFGDGNVSNDLPTQALTNHIYTAGGDYVATLTGYKYIPEADNIFNKKARYSGQAIVAQKEVSFFVNLPLVKASMTTDGGIQFSSEGSSQSSPSGEVSFADQVTAVLGSTTSTQKECRENQVNITGPQKINANSEETYTLESKSILSNLKPTVNMDKSLKDAGCQLDLADNAQCVDCVNNNNASFRLKCDKQVKGALTVNWSAPSTESTTTSVPCTSNLAIQVVGDQKCNNSVYVLDGEKCVFKKDQCSSVLNQCKCGITKVASAQDSANPLKYTFTIVTPTDSNAKSFIIDFGDKSKPETVTTKTATHTYDKAGQYTVVAKSYTENPPGSNECGKEKIVISPSTCQTGTFSADKYSGDTSKEPVQITFANAGANNVASYSIKYGDGKKGQGAFTSINKYSYTKQGSYRPVLTGYDGNGNNCGRVSLDKAIVLGGISSDAASYITKFEAKPSSGEATETAPLKVSFNAEINVPADGQNKATEYAIEWGDNKPTETKKVTDFTKINGTLSQVSFDHQYTAPNPDNNQGTYTATLRGYYLDDKGEKVNYGSKSVAINVTNSVVVPISTECQFKGAITYKPKEIKAQSNVTFSAKNIKKVDGAKYAPTTWQYNFGDGESSKDITGKIKKQKVNHTYTESKDFSVVLTGFYDSNDSRLNCGSIATAITVKSADGKTPTKSCNVGTLTVSPATGDVGQEVTATLANISSTDRVQITWGDKKTENVVVKGKTTITVKHTYLVAGEYKISVVGYLSGLKGLCGETNGKVTIGGTGKGYAVNAAVTTNFILEAVPVLGSNPLVVEFQIKDKTGTLVTAPNGDYSIVVTQVGFENDPQTENYDGRKFKFCGPDAKTSYKAIALKKASGTDPELSSAEISIAVDPSADTDKCDK